MAAHVIVILLSCMRTHLTATASTPSFYPLYPLAICYCGRATQFEAKVQQEIIPMYLALGTQQHNRGRDSPPESTGAAVGVPAYVDSSFEPITAFLCKAGKTHLPTPCIIQSLCPRLWSSPVFTRLTQMRCCRNVFGLYISCRFWQDSALELAQPRPGGLPPAAMWMYRSANMALNGLNAFWVVKMGRGAVRMVLLGHRGSVISSDKDE